MADFFASWYLESAWCSRIWPPFITLETLPVGLLVLIMAHGLQGRPSASAINLVCYCFFYFFSHGNNVKQLSGILVCSYSFFFSLMGFTSNTYRAFVFAHIHLFLLIGITSNIFHAFMFTSIRSFVSPRTPFEHLY